jgi:uncharacterized protein with PIN domain
MDPEVRFVADVMLGRLARWLRALGYDALYEPALDDGALADLARRENRVLLTRDVELTRRRGLQALLVDDDRVSLQLIQICRDLDLNAQRAFTRCLECNIELDELQREDAALLVPPYVRETQTRFRRCPRCGRVYWRGTHWTRMRAVLEAIESQNG